MKTISLSLSLSLSHVASKMSITKKISLIVLKESIEPLQIIHVYIVYVKTIIYHHH